MADLKNSPRAKAQLKRMIIFFIFLGIGVIAMIVGLCLGYKNIMFWVLLIVGFGIALTSLIIWLRGRARINNITCPKCGEFYSYPNNVRVRVGAVVDNYETDVNIKNSYDRITVSSKTSYTGSDVMCGLYCKCGKCGGYSGFNHTFKLGQDRDLDWALTQYFNLNQ